MTELEIQDVAEFTDELHWQQFKAGEIAVCFGCDRLAQDVFVPSKCTSCGGKVVDFRFLQQTEPAEISIMRFK